MKCFANGYDRYAQREGIAMRHDGAVARNRDLNAASCHHDGRGGTDDVGSLLWASPASISLG